MNDIQKILTRIADMLCEQEVDTVISTLRTIVHALDAVSYSEMKVTMAALEVDKDAE